ncbi:CPBP family intramembrane glutamic endopeptidase [Cellulomonas shaoxiangyii]|uniref:CPBP family intramembrane metalloprotease n=1 Tax=Cellulomonas shaoxiangyii TaxID=2566013 RepID=A0A4P7SFI7_9CELL|nr:CPBP family intramembrane glutamic endopeptidase [Cellulomonas shaoxiangyii]QCB92308.1 CPBP family intramembrane metalloprotease [Cellulomonas shaoxiangyii]TGY86297.1 CPBP family intramembrane metalloprotease [Cellulomonas shaoxiangyii]
MTTPPYARTGTRLAVGLAALALVALGTLLALAPAGVRESADDGAPVVPYWQVLLPAAVALALIRLLPPRAPDLAPAVVDRRRLGAAVAALLACAVAFPVVVGVADVGRSEWYHLVKVLLLVAVPGLVVAVTRGATSAAWAPGAWRWWAPAVVLVVWTALSQAAPWVPVPDYSAYPVELVVAAALATAVAAGIGEELFYRVWLQTRLEALLGRWGGIAVATAVFALMHVGTRQGQGPVVEVAAALVAQGSFGLTVGYLWSRYRNVPLTIAMHLVVNGYLVVVALTR